MIGIYKITNLINKKIYIGQSVDIDKRLKRHKTTAFNKNSKCYEYPLYRSIRKYGLENFSFEIIEECKIEELEEKEKYYIQLYNSNDYNFGYNQTMITEVQHGFNKLNKEKLEDIIDKIQNSDMYLYEIAEMYNVSSITIKDINRGHSWYNPNLSYPLRKNKKDGIRKKYYCECGNEKNRQAKHCLKCARLLSRFVERPSREELKNLIRNNTFTSLGKDFKVSDKTISKWCKDYNLPSTKTEIKKYTDKEWDNI